MRRMALSAWGILAMLCMGLSCAGREPTDSTIDKRTAALGSPVATPVGTNVTVDFDGGIAAVNGISIRFAQVLSAGNTNVIHTLGQPPPGGIFILAEPAGFAAFDLGTTAIHAGAIEICIHYDQALIGPECPSPDVTFVTECQQRMVKNLGSSLEIITSSLDTTRNIVCGITSELNPNVSTPDASTDALASDAGSSPSDATGDDAVGGDVETADGDAGPPDGGAGQCSRTFTAVSARDSSVCAVASDSTVECWGWNWKGELGNGTTTDSSIPITVPNLTGVTAVSTNLHTCALLSGGTVSCWGNNFAGELGDGTTADSSIPVAVPNLTGVTAVSAGLEHTCALLVGGTVACWGSNAFGELGRGFATPFPNAATPVPAAVPGLSGVAAISAGWMYTCALRTNGTVMCWGRNQEGQLGNGTTTDSPTPVLIPNLSGVTKISAGEYHACALLSNGTARCWGSNSNGELGNGTFTPSPNPRPVAVSNLSNATAISATANDTCALLSDGTIACWGYNPNGELGNGTTDFSPTPVKVLNLAGATEISGGDGGACALLQDGTVKCWGPNGFGQLGNGTTESSSIPAAVSCGVGHSCTASAECSSGQFCVDSVCCASACGGDDPSDCQACTVAAGATSQGTCSPRTSNTTCREIADVCDVPETCDGVSNNCPVDSKQPPGTACPDDGSVCTLDQCDGTSVACQHPPGNAGAECRAADLGGCDVAESCTGLSAACPEDGFAPGGTTCRESTGVCDVAETCTGTSAACPPDGFLPSSTTCRPSAGVCDEAETCTGSAAACPADGFAPSSTTCRPVATGDICDVAEFCTGNSATCPIDSTLPTNTCTSVRQASNPNTPISFLGGASVVGGVSITFGGAFTSHVEIKVVASSGGPPPPSGYEISGGGPPKYFTIEANPSTGYVAPRVCIGVAPGTACSRVLLHDAGSGAGFQPITGMRCDSAGHVCGSSRTTCLPLPPAISKDVICGNATAHF